MNMTLIWIITFIILLLSGIPIPIAMGAGVYVAILVSGKVTFQSVGIVLWSALNSFVLAAIPLFMLIGILMVRGDFVRRIFNFSNAVSGWMTGGLGAVNVVGSLIFGGISGSSTADAASLGPVEVEAMVLNKYPKDYAVALSVTSSTFAILIPPSIIMVVYAILAGESAARCLVAGFVPGLVVAFGMLIMNYLIAKKNGWGKSEDFDLRNILFRTRESFWAIITPVIIMGTIIAGLATPTEAAGIACVYCLIISLFVYKTLKLRELGQVFLAAGRLSGVALFLLSSASLITFMLDYEKVPEALTKMLVTYFENKTILMLSLLAFFLFIGCFIDALPALIILAPVLVPPTKALGIDPVHFGVIMVASLAIGLVTPPVGICLYTLSSIMKIPMESVAIRAIPFLAMMVVTLLIITFVPELSVWLPNLLLGK